MTKTAITGSELKAARKLSGLSQTELGELIGFSRHAISYWENQEQPISGWKTQQGLLRVYLQAVGLTVLQPLYTTTRTRGDGVLQYRDTQQEALDHRFEKELARIIAKEAQRAARHRQPCEAKTRKGRPCQNLSLAGRRRCKFHGGMSTGPRTVAGKKRIAKAQRRRWAVYRETTYLVDD